MGAFFKDLCTDGMAYYNYKKIGMYNTAMLENKRFGYKQQFLDELREEQKLLIIEKAQEKEK